MNVLLCVFITTVAFIILSQSERCDMDADCSHVGCDNKTHLACSHDVCTCIYGGNSCNSRSCKLRSECETALCHCGNTAIWHCYDQRCACGRSAVGK